MIDKKTLSTGLLAGSKLPYPQLVLAGLLFTSVATTAQAGSQASATNARVTATTAVNFRAEELRPTAELPLSGTKVRTALARQIAESPAARTEAEPKHDTTSTEMDAADLTTAQENDDTAADESGDTPAHWEALIQSLAAVEPVSVARPNDAPQSRATSVASVLDVLRRNLYGRQDEITSGLLRDGNYLFFGGTDIKYEAQLAGDVLIHSRINDIAERVFDNTCDSMYTQLRTRAGRNGCSERHWGLHTYATIQLYLRMLDDSSAPIRTPSFIPKWTIQWVGLKRLATEQLAGSWASMWMFNAVPVGHHSNGQDGCPLIGYRRRNQHQKNGPCEPELSGAGAPATAEINTRNGSFSARVFHRGGMHHRWIKLHDSPANASSLEIARELTIGGMMEYNHVAGEQAEILAPRYGKFRLSASINHAWKDVGRWARVELGYRLQHRAGIEAPWVHLVEAVLFHTKVRPMGFYFRYYHGRDYLNIAFEQHVNRGEAGFTFDWETF